MKISRTNSVTTALTIKPTPLNYLTSKCIFECFLINEIISFPNNLNCQFKLFEYFLINEIISFPNHLNCQFKLLNFPDGSDQHQMRDPLSDNKKDYSKFVVQH